MLVYSEYLLKYLQGKMRCKSFSISPIDFENTIHAGKQRQSFHPMNQLSAQYVLTILPEEHYRQIATIEKSRGKNAIRLRLCRQLQILVFYYFEKKFFDFSISIYSKFPSLI